MWSGIEGDFFMWRQSFFDFVFLNGCFFFILSLTACNYYTIQNSYKEDVRAGYVVIKSDQCSEFFDFPVFGDFPLQFRYKDHQLMSDKLYPPGYYQVSSAGDIVKQEKPCELDPVRKRDDLGESRGTNSAPSNQTNSKLQTQEDSNSMGENDTKPVTAGNTVETGEKSINQKDQVEPSQEEQSEGGD